MAIRWNLEDVENYEELLVESNDPHTPDDEKKLRAFADVIVELSALSTGIPSITDDNWYEAFLRIRICELTSGGGFLHDHTIDGPRQRKVQPGEVKRCIGLTTNGRHFDRDEFLENRYNFMKNKLPNKDDVETPPLDERDEWYEALRDEEKVS